MPTTSARIASNRWREMRMYSSSRGGVASMQPTTASRPTALRTILSWLAASALPVLWQLPSNTLSPPVQRADLFERSSLSVTEYSHGIETPGTEAQRATVGRAWRAVMEGCPEQGPRQHPISRSSRGPGPHLPPGGARFRVCGCSAAHSSSQQECSHRQQWRAFSSSRRRGASSARASASSHVSHCAPCDSEGSCSRAAGFFATTR